MTRCESISEDLKAYLDGELPLDRRAAVRLHVARCASCREEMAAMENVSRELKADEKDAFHPTLRNRLLESVPESPDVRIQSREAPLWNRRSVRLWATAASGVLIVFLILPIYAPAKKEAKDSLALRATRPRVQVGQQRTSSAYANAALPSESRVESLPSSASTTIAPVYDGEKAKSSSLRDDGKGLAEYKASSQPAPNWGVLDGHLKAWRKRNEATGFEARSAGEPRAIPEREVIRTASVGLDVVKLEEKSEAVERMVKESGGFVVSNHLSTGGEGVRTAALVVRVPVERFDAFIKDATKLGEVTAKSVNGQDVTEKVSDQSGARTVLRQELSDTRERIRASNGESWQDAETERQLKIRLAQVEGRLELLHKLSALGKIEITLTERPKTAIKSGGFLVEMGDTGRVAVNSFLNAARIPILLLIWVGAYAPIWVPLAIGFRYALRAHRKHAALREAREWRAQRETA